MPLAFSDLWCHPPVLLKVLYPCLAGHLLSFLEQYRIVETANSINLEAEAAALRLAQSNRFLGKVPVNDSCLMHFAHYLADF